MLGIIGGNGVAATNRLLTLIEEKFTKGGAYRDCHHPEMIVWQATQAPSRSMFLEGRGPSFIEDYVEIGKKLGACGCTELCMCCNTAHYAVDELSEKIGLPFINIMDEVAQVVNEKGCKKVLVMCTAGLRKYHLYERSFSKYAPNTEVVYPTDDIQEWVTKGICNAKNTYRFSDRANEQENPYNWFMKVCKYYRDRGDIDCIIGGCTDIRNVFFPTFSDVEYIDSLDVLANRIFNKYKLTLT
jgi:aspartate racemase